MFNAILGQQRFICSVFGFIDALNSPSASLCNQTHVRSRRKSTSGCASPIECKQILIPWRTSHPRDWVILFSQREIWECWGSQTTNNLVWHSELDLVWLDSACHVYMPEWEIEQTRRCLLEQTGWPHWVNVLKILTLHVILPRYSLFVMAYILKVRSAYRIRRL